jgi:flagellar basal body L-ring protein FlgH
MPTHPLSAALGLRCLRLAPVFVAFVLALTGCGGSSVNTAEPAPVDPNLATSQKQMEEFLKNNPQSKGGKSGVSDQQKAMQKAMQGK